MFSRIAIVVNSAVVEANKRPVKPSQHFNEKRAALELYWELQPYNPTTP